MEVVEEKQVGQSCQCVIESLGYFPRLSQQMGWLP